jgi:DnaD/phage-associated family protein
MTSFLWWRSWHGAPMDSKWAVIANRAGVKPGIVSAIFWELCDFASQHVNRGSIEGFDIETYAVFSGFSQDEIAAVIKALTDKKIIENNFLSNWIKRQPIREDDSRERVTKFRELKRSVTQCNTHIKIEDKDTKSDKEKEEQQLQPPNVNVAKYYEDNFGPLTAGIADLIDGSEKEYSENMILDAMKEAVKNNVRKWSYVASILNTWKTNGKNSRKKNGELTEEERHKYLTGDYADWINS